jgi:hypothetical protein
MPPPNMPPMKLAYAIGRTLGCGEAGYVVNAGAMSPPLKRMKAPLLPLRAADPQRARPAPQGMSKAPDRGAWRWQEPTSGHGRGRKQPGAVQTARRRQHTPAHALHALWRASAHIWSQ